MEQLLNTNFTVIDWVIVAGYIAGITFLGNYLNRYIGTSSSTFMVGAGKSPLALNTASFVGTELGLVTIMYAAIEGYTMGFSYLVIPLVALVASFIIGKTGFAVSKLRALKLTTIPEFFEKRYSKKIRVLSAFMLVLAGVLNMGLFPKMGAAFITYATGISALSNPEMIVNIVMSVLIVLVVLYTIRGGMVAVLVCDFIQFCVLSVGLLIGLGFVLMNESSGMNEIVNSYTLTLGEKSFNPFSSESYGTAYIIWMFIVFFVYSFAWGPTVARALTAKNEEVARKTFLLGTPGQFIRLALPALIAMGAFAYFRKDGDLAGYFFPNGTPDMSHAIEAMPLFLGKLLPVGFIGVLTAGLLAAFMSTHDSYLLTWGSVISRDIVVPLKKAKINEKQEIWIARLAIVIIGVFLLVWGIWYELPDSIWTYMAITGNIYLTGAASAIIGGLYWKRSSKTGALAALLSGLASVAGIIPVVSEVLPIGVLGLSAYLFSAVVFIVFSLMFPDKKATI
jgi:SSS family solute:Na+ symporter